MAKKQLQDNNSKFVRNWEKLNCKEENMTSGYLKLRTSNLNTWNNSKI